MVFAMASQRFTQFPKSDATFCGGGGRAAGLVMAGKHQTLNNNLSGVKAIRNRFYHCGGQSPRGIRRKTPEVKATLEAD